VCVRQPHSLFRQGIKVRRLNLRLGIVAAQVTVAEIVGEDDDDVRAGGDGCAGRQRTAAEHRAQEDNVASGAQDAG
jgi:hypothetical protein